MNILVPPPHIVDYFKNIDRPIPLLVVFILGIVWGYIFLAHMARTTGEKPRSIAFSAGMTALSITWSFILAVAVSRSIEQQQWASIWFYLLYVPFTVLYAAGCGGGVFLRQYHHRRQQRKRLLCLT